MIWRTRRTTLTRTGGGYVLATQRDPANQVCEWLTEAELRQLREAIDRELRGQRVGPSEVKG